jgi:hypothetical protein
VRSDDRIDRGDSSGDSGTECNQLQRVPAGGQILSLGGSQIVFWYNYGRYRGQPRRPVSKVLASAFCAIATRWGRCVAWQATHTPRSLVLRSVELSDYLFSELSKHLDLDKSVKTN